MPGRGKSPNKTVISRIQHAPWCWSIFGSCAPLDRESSELRRSCWQPERLIDLTGESYEPTIKRRIEEILAMQELTDLQHIGEPAVAAFVRPRPVCFVISNPRRPRLTSPRTGPRLLLGVC